MQIGCVKNAITKDNLERSEHNSKVTKGEWVIFEVSGLPVDHDNGFWGNAFYWSAWLWTNRWVTEARAQIINIHIDYAFQKSNVKINYRQI